MHAKKRNRNTSTHAEYMESNIKLQQKPSKISGNNASAVNMNMHSTCQIS
jgi:hypothetical protein